MEEVVSAYTKNNPAVLVEHHLLPFNEFCNTGITEILQGLKGLDQRRERTASVFDVARIRLGEVRLVPPKMPPAEAIAKDSIYAFKIVVQVGLQFLERKEGAADILVKTEDVGGLVFCSLPAMVRSSVCLLSEWDENDLGGHFIVDGRERVLPLVEGRDPAALVVRRHRGNLTAELHGVKIVCCEDTDKEYHGEIEVHLPGKKRPFPLFVVMRAFGLLSDLDVVDHILLGKDVDFLGPYLVPSVHASGKIFNPTLAALYIGGVEKEDEDMAYMVGRMVRKLLLVRAGAEKVTDDAALDLVLLKTSGAAVRDVFRAECERWQGLWEKTEFGDVRAFFQQAREIGKTVANLLTEPIGERRVSALRRVRRLHPQGLHATHWGFYDVVTGTELATMARISESLNAADLQTVMTLLGVIPLDGATAKEHGKMVRVVVDGRWIGSLSDVNGTMQKLKEFRRANLNLNVSLVDMELSVRTTEGRLQRPVFLATELKTVAYIDSLEASAAFIAENVGAVEKRHTHAEVHGSFLYGQQANRTLVFGNHTPISLSNTACTFRATTVGRGRFLNPEEAAEELVDGEVPMVRSVHAPAAAADGLNVTVAFMCYENNAITLNKGAVDRGLFRTYRYVTKYTKKKEYKVGDDVGGGWKVVQIFITKQERQKIRLQKECPADVGTIFGARSGLKSVCSAVVPEKEMPFSGSTGVCPDVIINPLLVESVALLLEGLFGKVHATRGSIADGTAFQPVGTTEKYAAELRKGMGKYREDTMVDGKTGTQVHTAVFVAPVYLRREKAPDAESISTFGEAECSGALANGMAAVVQDAVNRGERKELCVDTTTGVQAVENKELGVLVAPELDGPLVFDGQMKPLTARRHPNRFVTVRLPKQGHEMLSELRSMNIQMRFITRPSNAWFNMEEETMKACVFRALSTEPFEMLDNFMFVSSTPTNCGDAMFGDPVEPYLFPTVETKDWLLRLLIGALEITPTADSKRAVHNQDKLDMDVYANMDWRSARQTLQYCFRKTGDGVFVRIQNNRVANFFPLRNFGYSNDFSDRLSLDGKEAANPNALETLNDRRPSKWIAVGNVVQPWVHDNRHAQLYDMLVNTCSRMVVHDCVVVFNRSDYPYLGADHLEANPNIHGVGKKVDSVWKKTTFIPILSLCTTDKHADLPVPTADDWEGITQNYFRSESPKEPCRNRYLFGDTTPWANRTASVPKSDEDPGHTLPVFYWRAVANGDPHHPRTLLEAAGKRYSKERKGAAIKAGVLDVATTPWGGLRLAFVPESNLIMVHPPAQAENETEKRKDLLPPKLVDQAKKYKFMFNVEGTGASYRFGAFLRLGFCVLHVETPYQLWFERLTDSAGVTLLKGGDVEEYKEDWCFLSVKRDLSNLERTVEWCIQNDEKCKRVAENGKRFCAAHFTKQYVYEYMAATLNAVSARQRVADRTQQEEQTWLKDLTTTYDTLTKLPALTRHTYDVAAPASLKKTVVVVPCKGKEQYIALQQWLKHHRKYNVLIVQQAEGAFNRGALLNAAYLYVTAQCPEIETFVFADPEALFNTDFTQRYFGADGKDCVDFGKSLDMPLTWAVKVSKEVFKKVNGFPNNMPDGGANEAFENRLRISEVPVYTPSARPMLKAPKKEAVLKADVRGALVIDALQWRLDGINTLQYAVTQIKVGNWTVKPPTDDANFRTVTVRLTPDVELVDLPSKQKQLTPLGEDTSEAETPLVLENKIEGGAEPEHLKTMELLHSGIDTGHAADSGGAMNATTNASMNGGTRVVNILDDDLHVASPDRLSFLENTESMPTDTISNVKKVNVQM